ncbi:MAG: RNA 2',3'-cyclic phosphodiesterase [Sulfuricaulis sp.]|uniref:RNA 2',3'-cyclic phosphodiesterase n=1 Tax=Sulfuricaulis sp. TaxID=2003553 RepID=UPI002600B656|nr:RNA 2',3'-cyclic phosphodiesterase [Sulfuricaulis sp.]MCR4347201.1 RNA 2',3'-cyclic phosphodiesterase [Sulfuricaulis sp.]
MTPADTPSSTAPIPRLFFALWPPIELSQELYRLAGNVLRDGSVRRVVPENIHLTLALLGSVGASFRGCAEQTASAVRVEPFMLALEQMGCWPKSGILWVGPGQSPEPLSGLVQVLNTGLGACGYRAEKRPYAAHLTLSRKLRPCVPSYSIERHPWEINQFHLVQSHTFADSAHYQILRSWPLNSPAA